MNKAPNEQPTGRESFNRIMGLGAYAGFVLMVGLLGFGIVEYLRSRHPSKDDLSGLAIVAVAALIFLGLGYSSGRKSTRK